MDDDEGEIKMIPGSRANLMEVRRRALEVSGIGRAARAAGGGGGAANLVAMVLALSAAGVRGAPGPLVGAAGPSWPGPTLGSGADVCLGGGGGDGTSYFGFYLYMVLLMCVFGFGAAIGYVVGRRSAPVPPALTVPPAPPAAAAGAGAGPSVRSVGTQSPTTYTAVRGAVRPRFLPLPESAAGVGL